MHAWMDGWMEKWMRVYVYMYVHMCMYAYTLYIFSTYNTCLCVFLSIFHIHTYIHTCIHTSDTYIHENNENIHACTYIDR